MICLHSGSVGTHSLRMISSKAESSLGQELGLLFKSNRLARIVSVKAKGRAKWFLRGIVRYFLKIEIEARAVFVHNQTLPIFLSVTLRVSLG